MRKQLTPEEYKNTLTDILVFFDKVCRTNGIKYSLIGGSLIGAIREGGIIPWDDDIDVVMMPDEYRKFLQVMSKNPNKNYKLLIHGCDNEDYLDPYPKLIDIRTSAHEEHIYHSSDYGVFLDIFSFHYVSKNKLLAKCHYYRMVIYKMLYSLSRSNKKYRNIFKKTISYYAHRVGPIRLSRKYMKLLDSKKKVSDFIMTNWPTYGFDREITPTRYFEKYIDWRFEKHRVMIIQEYDAVLKQFFGDYMTPPPEGDRKSHGMIAYWKKKK